MKGKFCIDPWSKSASGTAPSSCSAIVPSGSGSQIASTFPAGSIFSSAGKPPAGMTCLMSLSV